MLVDLRKILFMIQNFYFEKSILVKKINKNEKIFKSNNNFEKFDDLKSSKIELKTFF